MSANRFSFNSSEPPQIDPKANAEQGRSHVLRSAQFYRNIGGSDRVTIASPFQVSIEGRNFDLSDPTQRILSDALLQVGISEQTSILYIDL